MWKTSNWREKSIAEKVRVLLRILLSFIVISIALLGILDVIDIQVSNNIVMPIMGLVMILIGLDEMKKNKWLAFMAYGVALFIFIVGLSILFRYIGR